MQNIRTRFAPSPTGGLHIGGLRTALYNYLFAKKNNGTFILRIEDTDTKRFVEGAEEYIQDALRWCKIPPDESPIHKGEFGPYRQSERKDIYQGYAWELVKKGKAYLAFDTSEELEALRQKYPKFKYDYSNRDKLNNSITLSQEETKRRIDNKETFVIRFKSEPNNSIQLIDEIKGKIHFDTNVLDDKILLKQNGLPTYHLAVVVDDYLMKISHVFRGEEWLPSYPIHHLLQEALGWQESKPKYIHLPLILKPHGNGKLSKRDAEQFDFPIFPMAWENKKEGYKEVGFLPESLLNFLVKLGWSDGSTKEFYSLDELIKIFDIKHIQNASAKFDYEKAKWFNHHYLQKTDTTILEKYLQDYLKQKNIVNPYPANIFHNIISLVKERCYLINDIVFETLFFFNQVQKYDPSMIEKIKSLVDIKTLTQDIIDEIDKIQVLTKEILEENLHKILEKYKLKKSQLMIFLRYVIVGEKRGVGIMDIILLIGKEECIKRLKRLL